MSEPRRILVALAGAEDPALVAHVSAVLGAGSLGHRSTSISSTSWIRALAACSRSARGRAGDHGPNLPTRRFSTAWPTRRTRDRPRSWRRGRTGSLPACPGRRFQPRSDGASRSRRSSPPQRRSGPTPWSCARGPEPARPNQNREASATWPDSSSTTPPSRSSWFDGRPDHQVWARPGFPSGPERPAGPAPLRRSCAGVPGPGGRSPPIPPPSGPENAAQPNRRPSPRTHRDLRGDSTGRPDDGRPRRSAVAAGWIE